jgi:hypothetical protein
VAPTPSATPPSIKIQVSASPGTGGTVTGAGAYAVGTQIKLEATATSGYKFTSWTESGTTVSTSATYAFAASTSKTLIANFSSACAPVKYEFDFSTLRPGTLPSFLRQGIQADVATQTTAVEMHKQGWRYTMPDPKSAQARWGNTDGRTTWWYGYWSNAKTNPAQVSKTQPQKNGCGLYYGDGQDLRGTWRRGGTAANPTKLEWLLSASGGPNQ